MFPCRRGEEDVKNVSPSVSGVTIIPSSYSDDLTAADVTHHFLIENFEVEPLAMCLNKSCK